MTNVLKFVPKETDNPILYLPSNSSDLLLIISMKAERG